MARDAVTEVKDRTDMVGLVSGYVQLRKAGRNFKGLCPFHQEKTPSFIVFPESGTFKCFGCGKGGDALTFYKDIEHIEFREALQELARRAGIEISAAPPPSPERDAHRNRLIQINEMAATFFAAQLKSGAAGEAGRALVEARELSPAVVEQFQIGVAPDSWDALATFLSARGVDPAMAIEVGLLSERDSGGYYDRFRNRLVFPIRDREGLVVGFGARAFGDEMPKYLNSPQTAIFDKSHLLYGLDRARDDIRRLDQVVVVEGYMDVLAAHQFGYRNVVASMGTAVTESQIGLVRRLTKNVVLALDADAAGQNAMVRALESLPSTESEDVPVIGAGRLVMFERRLSVNIKVLAVPDGKDPDEYIRANPEAWPGTVAAASPFLQFYVQQITQGVDLTDPRAKEQAVQRAAQLLSLLPDGVEMRHYVDLLAGRLRLADRDPIFDAIRVARRSRSGTAAPVAPVARSRSRTGAEDYLVGMILTYPDILAEFVMRIDPDDLVDSVNREILMEQVFEGERTGERTAYLDERVLALKALLNDRVPMSRVDVVTEATRALEKMRRDRLTGLIQELRLNISDAERENDIESLRLWLDAMKDLTALQKQMYPRKSTVFKDTRDHKSGKATNPVRPE